MFLEATRLLFSRTRTPNILHLKNQCVQEPFLQAPFIPASVTRTLLATKYVVETTQSSLVVPHRLTLRPPLVPSTALHHQCSEDYMPPHCNYEKESCTNLPLHLVDPRARALRTAYSCAACDQLLG